jgi:NTP pyrophosphatase (non-canonical NTP hydrolase)
MDQIFWKGNWQEVPEAVVLMETYEESDSQMANKYKDEAASEAADVIAWAIAVSNEVDVNLENAFVERYGKGCPNCKNYPCKCGEFSHKQERKVLKEM